MRLLLAALCLVVAGILPAVVAREAVAVQELGHRNAGGELGPRFEWPADERVADLARGYEVLAAAARSAGVNLVRGSTALSTASRPEVAYFVYLGRARSALFDRLDLVSGRWLTPEDMANGAAVVTTADVRDGHGGGGVEVVGVPRVWGDRYDLSIEPLSRAYRSLALTGTYTIDARAEVDADRFLADIQRFLDDAGAIGPLAVAPAAEAVVGDRAAAGHRYTPPVLGAVFAALATAAAARDGRRIGVMRLLGFPATRVWLLIAGRVLLGAACVGAASLLAVMARTPGADPDLAARLAVPLAAAIGLGAAATAGLAAVLVRRVRISDLVKGRVS